MSPDPRKPGCRGSDDDDDCHSPPSSDGSRHLVTPLVVTAFALVFLALASLSIYCFIRRRRRRRRQQSLLAAAGAANPGAVQGAGPAPEMAGAAAATDVEGGAAGPEDEEVVHHAWHIRTVGLDEKAIESIALTRYRADGGMLGGAGDCSVCLGEFLDGDLLRLLPKCGHAFHVPCIGTWLRAHVNCPLCRADVVVLPGSAATAGSDPPADDAQHVSEILSHEQPGPAQQRPNEQQELRVQIDRRNRSRSPEPQRRRMQSFRRVASMDSSVVSAGAGLVPEDKRIGTENQGNGEVPSGSGRLRYLSGGGRRSLLSRHRRTSSSMLPS